MSNNLGTEYDLKSSTAKSLRLVQGDPATTKALLELSDRTRWTILEYVRNNAEIVSELARHHEIGRRSLELETLLYIPRLIDSTGQLPKAEVLVDEIDRVGWVIANRVRPYAAWRAAPLKVPANPRDTLFDEVGEAEARIIHEKFHYLSSFRTKSSHFGLLTIPDNRLMALISISRFDLPHIASQMPEGVDGSQAMVVSRVFCFDWAPRNTISHLLSRAIRVITEAMPQVRMFVTYVNPNLGFTGASYKASNWVVFGREWGTRYTYLDESYVTDRYLTTNFGTADPGALMKMLGKRFEVTRVPLAPLSVYAYFSDKKLGDVYSHDLNANFERP